MAVNENMTDDEAVVQDLRAGILNREQVTDVSGRGVIRCGET